MNIRGALTIAGVMPIRLRRDRTALFFIVLMPVMIIFVIGIAIGGFGSRIDLGVVGADTGPLAHTLRVDLARSRAVTVHDYGTRASLQRAFRHGTAFAGVVIPRDYDRALREGHPANVAFISDPTRSATGAVRTAVNAAVARSAALVGATRFGRGGFDETLADARAQADQGAPVVVRSRSSATSNTIPDGFGWTAPTNLVLFVFITSMASSGRLVQLRTSGLARRVLASPVSAGALLAGELLASFALAVAQGLLIIVVGTFVFDVHWGALGGALSVLAATAVVATGLGVLVGTLVSTVEQASVIGPPVGIALGMLGGCMWPLAIVGRTMRLVGHVTPQAWAMDAYIKLIGAGGGVRDILPQLAALGLFALAFVPLAAWRLRRVILAGA